MKNFRIILLASIVCLVGLSLAIPAKDTPRDEIEEMLDEIAPKFQTAFDKKKNQ